MEMYLHTAFAISPQSNLDKIEPLEGDLVKAIPINYKEIIPPMALRRMSTAVKMGLASGLNVLKEVNLNNPSAIITSTGMGCLEDTEKFLTALIEQKEELLSPTSFIQSTHNTIGAQIALNLGCTNYNNTISQGSTSFEAALMDAELFLFDNADAEILIGAVDELGSELIPMMQRLEAKNDNGLKVPFSEGAAFFHLNSKKTSNAIKISTETYSSMHLPDLASSCKGFLNSKKVDVDAVDLLLLGQNDDSYDSFYNKILEIFPNNQSIVAYKKYFGEHFSSSAMAVYLGYIVLTNQIDITKLTTVSNPRRPIKCILIYQQFKGRDHGFTLLTA